MATSVLDAVTGLPKRSPNPISGGFLGQAAYGPGGGLSGFGVAGSTSAGATPTAAPAAGGGGAGFPSSITIGGSPPGPSDYANAILNDPQYMALRNQLSAQGIASAAQLRGHIQQALIQLGEVPGGLPADVAASAGLDTGLTGRLAAENPFSMLARLAQSYQDRQDQAKNQLAARGILSSGETGYQLGRLGQANAQNVFDAESSTLGQVGNWYDEYVAGRNAAANLAAQGAITAENTAAQNAPTSAPTSPAYYDTANSTPGSPVYRDAAGNYYDRAGNPIDLPTPTPPPPSSGPSSGAGVAPQTAPTPFLGGARPDIAS